MSIILPAVALPGTPRRWGLSPMREWFSHVGRGSFEGKFFFGSPKKSRNVAKRHTFFCENARPQGDAMSWPRRLRSRQTDLPHGELPCTAHLVVTLVRVSKSPSQNSERVSIILESGGRRCFRSMCLRAMVSDPSRAPIDIGQATRYSPRSIQP